MPGPYTTPENLSSIRGIPKDDPSPGTAWQLVQGPVVGQSPGWPYERDWIRWTDTGAVLVETVELVDFVLAGMSLFDQADPYPVLETTEPGLGVNGAAPVERDPGVWYPEPGVYPAGTTFDLYFRLDSWVGDPPATTLGASCTFHISDSYTSPTPGDGGLYVGTIVLGDGISGIYRYTNIEEPFLYEWNAPFSADETWLGARENLSYTGGGFEVLRVEAGEDGWYPWTCTPLFAVENETTRLGVFVYDAVGDFYAIDEVRYVTSGDTYTGVVYLQAGFSATFQVGDDATPSGQATLVGSFWNFTD